MCNEQPKMYNRKLLGVSLEKKKNDFLASRRRERERNEKKCSYCYSLSLSLSCSHAHNTERERENIHRKFHLTQQYLTRHTAINAKTRRFLFLYSQKPHAAGDWANNLEMARTKRRFLRKESSNSSGGSNSDSNNNNINQINNHQLDRLKGNQVIRTG